MQNGIDNSFIQMGVEFGKPNKTFINQFKTNTAIFAAFKSHEEQTQLNKLMLDEKGKLRSYYDFRKAAKPVIGNYNVNYLKTEYDTVVRSARMAANWKKFEEKKDIFPNIEYMLSRANDKRPEHLEFVGTIRPIHDSWWNTHTPPIDWGCQCWIRQTRTDITPVPQDEIEVPEIFQNNPGKTAEPFVIEKTNYVKNSKITRKQVESYLSKNTNYSTKLDVINDYPNGGKIEQYSSVKTDANDYQSIFISCRYFAEKGEKTIITPAFNGSTINNAEYKSIYGSLKDTKYWGKCPDFKVGDNWYEHEGFTTAAPKKAFRNMLGNGLKQSNRIIIQDCGLTDGYMKRVILGRITAGQDIKEVWVIKNNNLNQIY